MKSERTVLIRLASVALIAAVAISSAHFFRSPPQNHRRAALEGASKYVSDLPTTTTVLMYNDNQPTTAFRGNTEVADVARRYLEDARPGRYRRAWGQAQIEVIILPGITTLPDDARMREISGLNLRSDIAADVQQVSAAKQFCSAQRYSFHGWSYGGFVLVDSKNANDAKIKQCVLQGFDYLDGLPTPENKFDSAALPSDEIRYAIVDYVRSCAFESPSNSEKQQKSRYGIFAEPDMTCVRDKLKQAVAKAK